MPVENRLDMELTGIKTAVGIKIQGADLDRIQDIGAQMQQILSTMPETSSVFAERVSQGFYLNVEVNRPEAARYGLTVADVQRVVIVGHRRHGHRRKHRGPRALSDQRPIPARFPRHLEALSQALIATPSGAQIPIERSGARLLLARTRHDPRRRRRAHRLRLPQPEYERLRRLREPGRPSAAAEAALPAGYTWRWAGEYEFELRAKERLKIILPIVFFVIFLLLYLVFKSVTEAAVLIFPNVLCHVGRAAAAVVAWLQLQRRRLGRIHRAVRHRR